jgi:peroxiredoxin
MNRVNSIIAILLTGAVIAGYFLKMISNDAFMGLAGGAVVYFFPKAQTPTTPSPAILTTDAVQKMIKDAITAITIITTPKT